MGRKNLAGFSPGMGLLLAITPPVHNPFGNLIKVDPGAVCSLPRSDTKAQEMKLKTLGLARRIPKKSLVCFGPCNSFAGYPGAKQKCPNFAMNRRTDSSSYIYNPLLIAD